MSRSSTESFEVALAWFQKELGTFFKPSLFMTNYNFDLFHAVHVLYESIPKFISIVDFLQKIWRDAVDNGLFKEKPVNENHLQLLSEMPKLLLTYNDDVKDQFQSLVDKYLPKDKYEGFFKPYMSIFLNMPSWYNISSLASTYKNIFLN